MKKYLLPALAAAASCLRAQAFDLSALPEYRPEQAISGPIRNSGFTMGGMVKVWEDGFLKHQPAARFEDRLHSSDAALGALANGICDVATAVREPMLTEILGFYETYGYRETDITVATGAYDVEGMACGLVIFVHQDNPITGLTMAQLDGIFGSERTGALDGFKWELGNGRSARDDLRTWGQLGLAGEWTDKPIHTYGYAPTGTAHFFQQAVLKGGDKWNPGYREYVESGSKMISDADPAKRGGMVHMFGDELANDRYGIAWGIVVQGRSVPRIRMLPLAEHAGGPYIAPTRESFQSRAYPLVRSIHLYVNRAPGKPLDPRVREFLRYILSREGQEAVEARGSYLPLPAGVARAQLQKLE
jgi:phosphate transport system substrate-binding protein